LALNASRLSAPTGARIGLPGHAEAMFVGTQPLYVNAPVLGLTAKIVAPTCSAVAYSCDELPGGKAIEDMLGPSVGSSVHAGARDAGISLSRKQPPKVRLACAAGAASPSSSGGSTATSARTPLAPEIPRTGRILFRAAAHHR
jgi:hypothetical protein